MKYNEQQQNAIQAEGNAIVSAGAGCGKTSVLVARCLQKILQEQEPASLRNILMITFMKDAAAEMKKRIRDGINHHLELLREKSEPTPTAQIRRLENELVYLESASISTIHSFCLELLRENFDLLPVLGVNLGSHPVALNESASQILMREAFSIVMKARYREDERLRSEQKQGEPLIVFLRDHLDNSQSQLRKMLFRLYYYTQSLASPQKWVEEQIRLANTPEPTQWERMFFGAEPEERGQFLQFLAPYGEDIWGKKATPEMRAALRNALQTPSLENQQNLLQEFCKAAVSRSGCLESKLKIRDKILSILYCFGLEPQEEPVSWPEVRQELKNRWNESRQFASLLLELLQEFQSQFNSQKESQGGLTFSDQLQYALALLRDPSSGEPTELALSLRQQYHFIFIDEFQDTDGIQDALIAALSSRNRFIVGDVKQSIYRFRLAEPRLFREYEEAAYRREGWCCYPLNKNYRSQADILNFANLFFRDLMKRQVGSVEFGEDSALEACAPAVPSQTPRVQLIWNMKTSSANRAAEAETEDSPEQEADLTDLEKEAILIAQKLLELKETLRVRDDSAEAGTNDGSPPTRPMKWSDVALLCRGGIEEASALFIREFERRSIPIVAPGIPFFDCVEVMDLLNIIHLLNNPRQDYPLMGLLFSPMFNVNRLEFIQLRTLYPHGCLWEAVEEACQAAEEHGSGIREKYPQLIEKLLQYRSAFLSWRSRLRYLPLSNLLEEIIEETRYEECLYALPFPDQKVKNIYRFLSLVQSYDPSGRQSVHGFLEYVKNIQELDPKEFTSANSSSGSDAVQMRTVHKSKGLEYPVVILIGMSKRILKTILEEGLGLNEEQGLILPARSISAEEGLPHRKDTLGTWCHAQQETRTLLGEELRILYVAMTRARDYLFLSLSSKAPELPEKETAPPFPAERTLLEKSSYADWFLSWLAHYLPGADAESLFTDGQRRITLPTEPPLELWLTVSSQTLQEEKSEEKEIPEELLTQNFLKLCDEKRKEYTWRYPHESVVAIPAKNSVSNLKKIEQLRRGITPGWQFSATGTGAAEDAAEKGTLFHRIMERLELSADFALLGPDQEFHRRQLEKMQAAGSLSAEELQQAQPEMLEQITRFWQSDVAKAFLSRWREVEREVPFTIRLGDAELVRSGFEPILRNSEEAILVQGVIDLVMLGEEEIWVLDYKTDRLSAGECPQKALTHAPQLNLYALALEAIYGLPVRKKYIAFVRPAQTIELP